MHEIKPGKLTTRTVKNNLKGKIEGLLQVIMHFHFSVQPKKHQHTRNSFYMMQVLSMVKYLGIPTYFLTLSFAELSWEELPYIINKLNNLGLSDKELKNLCYPE